MKVPFLDFSIQYEQIKEEVKLPKFDAATEAYIRERGWTPEEVAEKLKRPLPPGLGGLGQ